MNKNILTLESTTPNTYCPVKILAQSHDGATTKSFNVLTIAEGSYLGPAFDINGQFADNTEVDKYRAYLNGNTTISGNRGFSNQAFYLWVTDEDDTTTIVSGTNKAITHTFLPGYYTISASLRYSNSYYDYNETKSSYTLSVTSNVVIETIATELGLVRTPGDVNGDGSISLADTILCLSVLSGFPADDNMATADINNDGKIDMAEVLFTLRASAGL